MTLLIHGPGTHRRTSDQKPIVIRVPKVLMIRILVLIVMVTLIYLKLRGKVDTPTLIYEPDRPIIPNIPDKNCVKLHQVHALIIRPVLYDELRTRYDLLSRLKPRLQVLHARLHFIELMDYFSDRIVSIFDVQRAQNLHTHLHTLMHSYVNEKAELAPVVQSLIHELKALKQLQGNLKTLQRYMLQIHREHYTEEQVMVLTNWFNESTAFNEHNDLMLLKDGRKKHIKDFLNQLGAEYEEIYVFRSEIYQRLTIEQIYLSYPRVNPYHEQLEQLRNLPQVFNQPLLRFYVTQQFNGFNINGYTARLNNFTEFQWRVTGRLEIQSRITPIPSQQLIEQREIANLLLAEMRVILQRVSHVVELMSIQRELDPMEVIRLQQDLRNHNDPLIPIYMNSFANYVQQYERS